MIIPKLYNFWNVPQCQAFEYFSRLLFSTRGWSVLKRVFLSQKGLFFPEGTALSNKGLPCCTRDCPVPQGTAVSHKGLLCTVRYCPLQVIGLSHKILFCSSRDWSVPHGTTKSYKGLLCPTLIFDLFISQYIDSFVRDWSVPQVIGLSYKILFSPSRDWSVPHGTSLSHNRTTLSHKWLVCLTKYINVSWISFVSHWTLLCHITCVLYGTLLHHHMRLFYTCKLI